MVKLNKYVVKATIQTAAFFAVAVTISSVTALILEYLQPTGTQILGTLAIVAMLFCIYNMIKIQAGILESRDKLNKQIDKVVK